MLDLRTLGTLDLKGPDGVVLRSVLLQPKRAAILVYLAVARPRGTHRRDVLLPLFWPKYDEPSARHSLSQALYALRRSLGPGAIAAVGRDGVAVDPDAVCCDVSAFDRAAEDGRWAEALELYAGPFLHGFHLPDADGFERWADGERDRLRSAAAGAAWSLAREELEGGDPAEAKHRAEEAIRVLPTDEAAVRGFLQALHGAGDRPGVERFYRQWVARLAGELELEPSPEMAALAQKLLAVEGTGPNALATESRSRPVVPPAAATATGPDPASSPQEESARQSLGDTVTKRVPGWRLPALLTAVLASLVIVWFVDKGRDARAALTEPVPAGSADGPPVRVESSIAVLPFETISRDPDAVEWFVFGIREAISTQLMEVGGIIVRPPESAARVFGDGQKSLDAIAAELRVGAVVSGSVRLIDGRFRLEVRVVDVEGDTVLWRGTYDGEYDTGSAVLDTQRDIARQVAAALGAAPLESEEARTGRHPTESAQAWRLYRQGRFQESKATPESLHSAVTLYNEAIEADPGFGQPYAGIASAYGILAQVERWPPDQYVARITTAAKRALEIDSTLAAPYRVLGQLEYLTWDLKDAERNFQIALRLEPNEPMVHFHYAQFLDTVGRHEDAMTEIRKAQELDPVDPFIAANVGWRYYYARQFDEALAEGLDAIALDPRHWVTRWLTGVGYSLTGRHDSAIAELKRAVAFSEGGVDALYDLGAAFARAGQREEAGAVIGELIRLREESYINPSYIAYVYAALGDERRLMEWLDTAYREGDLYLIWFLTDPIMDPFREHPRFRALVRATGLHDYEHPPAP